MPPALRWEKTCLAFFGSGDPGHFHNDKGWFMLQQELKPVHQCWQAKRCQRWCQRHRHSPTHTLLFFRTKGYTDEHSRDKRLFVYNEFSVHWDRKQSHNIQSKVIQENAVVEKVSLRDLNSRLPGSRTLQTSHRRFSGGTFHRTVCYDLQGTFP